MDLDEEVWKRFKESGSLDEESLEKKDRAALILRLRQIESELYDYQHNMGLLLMERNNWTANYEQLKLAAAGAEDKLRREQAAHLIAISEAEKREERLRSALAAEKHCVYDLEKALRAMHDEFVEIKFKSEDTLIQAQKMVASIEQKSLAAESTFNDADTFLAKENNRHTDAERKLKEVESLEEALRRERQIFEAEHESHEIKIVRERQRLHDLEKMLHEGQERLLEGQRLLKEREDFSHERDVAFDQIEKDLLIARKTIEDDQASLHKEEATLIARLADVETREKNATKRETIMSNKERELLVLEEKLATKENIEIPKLIAKQRADFEAEKALFEAEMEQRHRSLENEQEKWIHLTELRDADIKLKEGELLEKEKGLEKKSMELKKIEENLDQSLMSLNKREKSLKIEEENIKIEKRNIKDESEVLNIAKQEFENLRRVIEEEERQIQNEQEKLIVIEEENNGLQILQKRIKEEIDDFRASKKEVANEAKQLKLEKESLDKDYRTLEEIREKANKESEHVNEEREKVLKWLHDEEDRLKQEKNVLMEKIEMDAEALRAEKEAFIGNLEHEHAEWFAKFESDHNDLVQNFELRRNELEKGIEDRYKQIERQLQERELEFQKKKERDMQHICMQRELALKEMEELRLERERHEKRRQEIAKIREEAEMAWSDIKTDIEELQIQRENLQEQRKSLQKESEVTLNEFKQLQKLKSDVDILEDNLMLCEQQPSQKNTNENEFVYADSQGISPGRISNLSVRPHCSPPSEKKSESNIRNAEDERLPKNAMNLMGYDIEHNVLLLKNASVIGCAEDMLEPKDSKLQDTSPQSSLGDGKSRMQKGKSKVGECQKSHIMNVVEDATIESCSHRELNISAVEKEDEKTNVVGIEHDETHYTTGENSVHNRMISVIGENGQQDPHVLPVTKQKEDKKGKSVRKRSRRSSLTDKSELDIDESEIEPELSSVRRSKRRKRNI